MTPGKERQRKWKAGLAGKGLIKVAVIVPTETAEQVRVFAEHLRQAARQAANSKDSANAD